MFLAQIFSCWLAENIHGCSHHERLELLRHTLHRLRKMMILLPSQYCLVVVCKILLKQMVSSSLCIRSAAELYRRCFKIFLFYLVCLLWLESLGHRWELLKIWHLRHLHIDTLILLPLICLIEKTWKFALVAERLISAAGNWHTSSSALSMLLLVVCSTVVENVASESVKKRQNKGLQFDLIHLL